MRQQTSRLFHVFSTELHPSPKIITGAGRSESDTSDPHSAWHLRSTRGRSGDVGALHHWKKVGDDTPTFL